MLEVELRPRAQLDLESIYIHIAIVLASPQAADKTSDAIYRSIERLAEFPDLGKVLESDRLSRVYRRLLCESYWIYYTYNDAKLTVWRIFHTSRDIEDYTYVDL